MKSTAFRVFDLKGHRVRFTHSKKYGFEYRIKGANYSGEGYEATAAARSRTVKTLVNRRSK